MNVGEDVMLPSNWVVKVPFGVKIGNHTAIDDYFYCTTRLDIGDYVHIGPQVTIIGGKDMTFTMGHFSFLSAGCRVMCASDEHLGAGIGIPWIAKEYRDNVISSPVTIEQFAGVSTNCILFPGVTVPEGTILGVGCVVRKSSELSPWSVYVAAQYGKPWLTKKRPSDKIVNSAREMGYEVSS